MLEEKTKEKEFLENARNDLQKEVYQAICESVGKFNARTGLFVKSIDVDMINVSSMISCSSNEYVVGQVYFTIS